jgi:ATP-binding cassette subfamily B protein
MSTISILWQFIKPSRPLFVRACFYSAINKIFDVLPELLIGVAVDIVAGKGTRWFSYFPAMTSQNQLFILTGIVFFVWIFESIFEYLHTTSWRRLTQLTQNRLRLKAFWHVEQLSMENIESTSPGKFSSLLNDDINQIERFLDVGINTIIHIIVGTLTISVTFIVSSPTLAFWALLPLPAIFGIAVYYYKKLAPGYRAVRVAATAIASDITTAILGILTIKCYSTEKYELARLKRTSEQYGERNRQVTAISASFTPAMRTVIVVGFVLTLSLGGSLVLKGSLSIGTYSMLVFLIQRLLWPFIALPSTIDLYQRSMAAAQRVFELLQTPLTTISGDKPVSSHELKGTIEFKNVSFKYPSDVYIFHNLSLIIAARTTVAFIGSTGAGKSTLAKLILRLYSHIEGEIYLDGTSIEEYKLTDLRRVIGYVGQESFLVDGTIADNIVYGTFNVSYEKMVEAARNAHAYEFIQELPQGFDTLVGTRGQQLSQGQKQRISLARALVKEPAVYIFDEVTSAVDNETESFINHSLSQLTHNTTVIIIAHRLAAVRNADVIHVLDHGTIIESGSHEELLRKNGLYANLWKLQTGE